MAAMRAATAAIEDCREGLLGAAREDGPTWLDFNRFCDRKSVFQLNP